MKKTSGSIMWIAIAVAVLLIAGVWFIARDSTPRLNGPTVEIAKFVGTSGFKSLPFEQQRQYLQIVDDREDEIRSLYNENKLKESELRTALQWGWLGKQLGRVQKYFSLPPGQQRVDYIEKLVDKKEKPKKPGSNSTPADKIKRDESTEDQLVASLPPDVRSQWEIMNKAYREARAAREKKTAATKPAT
jgi:hypothetical protein